ncbi:D-arabinono-1,4-lactone oxidase [Sandaracinus amylolyticus]|uniref:D-arabinono-1,4-lactone oxidase n=1 Tax=Sandaracinus amylolyticus TaxID=927083 RepID=UPI001F1D20BF|nr:D-arabinono-1,4-lactone oxidase [Sandaracinus amylolyticus]UJR80187.1 FAD-dependent oxidoreductase [Sandaracinus amylolyticus]
MRSFRTWSGYHTTIPARWATPGSEAEIAALLREADRAGRRVKVIGSGHSWSDIALPDDVCVDLRRMRRILAIDAAARTLRVQAGIRLEEITEALDRVGMALPILGSIAKQTIAGAIATGTHGSSLRHGNLASLVVGLRLVTPRGEIAELGPEHPWLPAARVSLGALGIVTEVTLSTTPAFRLEETLETRPVERVAHELRAIAQSAEYVKVWWLPTQRDALIFRYARTPRRAVRRPIARFVDEKIVNQTLFELALRAAGRYPSLTKHVNSIVMGAYFRGGSRVDRSDRCFNLAMPPIHRETELALELDDAGGLLSEVDEAIREDALVVNFPCEVRFVAGDDAWMSPAYGRDTCQIGFYQAESPHLARYFACVEEIGARYDARPHWGKEFSMPGERVRAAYPMAPAFLALRRELDPRGTVQNRFLDRVLGPIDRAHAMAAE